MKHGRFQVRGAREVDQIAASLGLSLYYGYDWELIVPQNLQRV